MDFDTQPDGKGVRRLRSWCRTCERIRNREQQRNRTPRQRELRREYQRFWAEVRRRRKGVPQRNWLPNGKRRVKKDRIVLNPAPLVREIERWVLAQDHDDKPHTRVLGQGYEALARLSGVPARSIYRIRTGESRHVSLASADKLCVAIGVPLALLYPEDSDYHILLRK